MEMTQEEKEILNSYRANKKRKRKKALQIFLLVLGLSVGAFAIYEYYVTTEQPKTVAKKEQTKTTKDTKKPEITLSYSKIDIEQGETIDYMKYVVSAEDDKDGDLKDKVKYNEVDTNQVGDAVITYSVEDKAGNVARKSLTVVIHEKEEEQEEPEQTETQSQQQTVQQAPSQQQPAQDTPTTTTPPVQPSLPPETRYFYFSDGYTMDNVASACQAALNSSGRSGSCTPIQDSDGIYLGMRLDLY